jgi:SAM-dependent methyltransferase
MEWISMLKVEEIITYHYGQNNLETKILTALENAGKNINSLTRDDIVSFDEFHFGGREETRALAWLANLKKGMHVLDVGSGVGGAARTLADEFGCLVTGIDLTEEYCQAAKMLTEFVGLSDFVKFHQASALEMFFEDEAFDVTWLQHVSMNIEDKKGLFKEIHRVTRPGGRLAIHEIMEGLKSNARYPVFWAFDKSISFLEQPDQIREMLVKSGYSEIVWNDVTNRAIELTRKRHNESAKPNVSPLGLNVIVPKDVPLKVENSIQNLEEGRILVIQAVFERL